MDFSQPETGPLADVNKAKLLEIALGIAAISGGSANRRTKKPFALIETKCLDIDPG
jgi:hypothetical protein